MKKIFGIVFIIIAIILGLGCLMQLPGIIKIFFNTQLSYALGYSSGALVSGVLAFFLLRWGIKMTRG